MLTPELEELYSNDHNEHRKFLKLSAAFSAPEGVRIDVFGIVVSSTLPKRCGSRASHKYCCSFFIIDPFHATPTSPVCVNLFLNNPAKFSPAYSVGDVLYCKDVLLQKYRAFPQLVGKYERSVILSFRNKQQTILGLGLPEDQQMDNRRGCLHKDDWEVNSYTSTTAAVDNIDSLLCAAIIRLSNWAHEFFKSSSMADHGSFPHANIHTLHYHYHLHHHSAETTYKQVYPPHIQSAPSSSIGGAVGADISKVDVIGLVVSNIKGTESTPTRLLLWDGTGNGYFPAIPGAARHIATIDRALQSAADSAEVWHQFVERSAQLKAVAESSDGSTEASSSTASDVPWDRELHLGGYLVLESHDLPDQMTHNQFLTHFQPGRWIRLRNLTIMNARSDFGAPVGEVRVDAHVSFLSPYFRDVRTLMGDYFVRIHQHLTIMEHQQKLKEERQRQQRITEAARQVAVTNGAQSDTALRRTEHNAVALAWILAFPVRAETNIAVEFFCGGKLTGWFPTDPAQFVQEEKDDLGKVLRRYFLFALRVDDNTEAVQVIFADEDAEYFLGGITADQYANDPTVAVDLAQKLTALTASGYVLPLYVRLYAKKLTPPHSKKRTNRGTPKKRLVKRLMGFNTVAPFQLAAAKAKKAEHSESPPLTAIAL